MECINKSNLMDWVNIGYCIVFVFLGVWAVITHYELKRSFERMQKAREEWLKSLIQFQPPTTEEKK